MNRREAMTAFFNTRAKEQRVSEEVVSRFLYQRAHYYEFQSSFVAYEESFYRHFATYEDFISFIGSKLREGSEYQTVISSFEPDKTREYRIRVAAIQDLEKTLDKKVARQYTKLQVLLNEFNA